MPRFLSILAFEWSMTAAALCFVLLRLYCRNRYARLSLFEDGFVILAWLCFLGQVTMDTVLFDMAFFNEELDSFASETSRNNTKVEALKVSVEILYVKDMTYYFSIYAAKAAILCFYARFIPGTMKKTRIALWTTVATVVAGFTVGIMLNLLLCMPISRNWDSNGDCSSELSSVAGSIISYFFHILTDLMIYILPFSVLRALPPLESQKIGVAITFALGFLCISFAVAVVVVGYVSSSVAANWITAVFEQTLCICTACALALEGLTAGCGFRKWSNRITLNRQRRQDTGSEAGTMDGGSRPQSDVTICDRSQNNHLDRFPKTIESLIGQGEIERLPPSRLSYILPKITPVTSYHRHSNDTEYQSNSPNSPGYTLSISSIVDFYDLERQLQLDDEKRQAASCSPVLEHGSSELQLNPFFSIDPVEQYDSRTPLAHRDIAQVLSC